MQNSLLILLVLCLLLGCQTSQQAAAIAPAPIKPLTFQGTFTSTKGVKTPLSCYCYDGGYLKTTAGATIAICLDGLNAQINCNMLQVNGSYLTKRNDPEPGSACSQGEMEYFQVTAYECK